jgi:acetyl esterase
MFRAAVVLLAVSAATPAFALDKTDVEYPRPGGKPLLLDIHVPDGPRPLAAAIVVHGGGFDRGTKKSYVGPVLEVLTKAGFAWLSIDNRMAPDDHFPQPVEEVDNAIGRVKKNAATDHVDPTVPTWKILRLRSFPQPTLYHQVGKEHGTVYPMGALAQANATTRQTS